MVAAAAAFDEVKQTCATCRQPDAVELRKEWGCDRPAPAPFLEVDCPRCFGRDPDCKRCNGTGAEPVDRCPWATMTQPVQSAIEMAQLVAIGILPAPGAWNNQASSGASAIRIILRCKSEIEEKQMKRPPSGR